MHNLEKEIREQPEVLGKIKALNHDTLAALTAEIKRRNPDFVYFAARGTSDHACIYAQYLYGIYLGVPSGLATPSVFSKYGARMRLDNSLTIGVSQSGAAEDVLSVIKDANSDGAITVAITNTPDSPLAKTAKYHLYCGAGLEKSIAATKTFTAQMYLLALLCAYWSGNEELMDKLDRLPGQVSELLETIPSQIDAIIPRYRFLNDGILLGRGLTYPIALEGALKVLETNRIRMKGYSISDFWHGPLAQVSERNLNIVIAAEGPLLDDAEKMINRLEELDSETIVLTDSDRLSRRGDFTLTVPKTGSDSTSPFLFAIVMQLFAYKLTVVKGIDPDNSNVLKKVTVTK